MLLGVAWCCWSWEWAHTEHRAKCLRCVGPSHQLDSKREDACFFFFFFPAFFLVCFLARYVYDKVHTCDWSPEEALTTPGREWRTASVNTKHGNVTVGSMICADREFPESARHLALNGAELILTPNACSLVDSQLRQFRTRAVENVLGVAMARVPFEVSYCSTDPLLHGLCCCKGAWCYVTHPLQK